MNTTKEEKSVDDAPAVQWEEANKEENNQNEEENQQKETSTKESDEEESELEKLCDDFLVKNTISVETTTLIDIELYKKKFEEYPSDIVIFAEQNNIQLLPLTSLRGQALALMVQPEVRGQKHIGRKEAVKFFDNIGINTTDAIQQFNKPFGLKRMKMRGMYCLQYPYECDTTDIEKRKGVSISGDKNTQIDLIKNWWKKNLVDVPNEEWQIGHLDPTINCAAEKNLAYQPPIQGKYRNRFKFDDFFIKMWPTSIELIPNMNKYYTDDEQQKIYEILKQKFEKQSIP
jgi:hypothetical protein